MGTICVPSKTLSPIFKRLQMGIFGFVEGDWSQECCHCNNIVGVILSLLRYTLLMPCLKNTALIFLELLLIECCAALVEPPMTSSLKYKNVNISKTKKDMPKRKTPFLFTLKSLLNKQQLFFTS